MLMEITTVAMMPNKVVINFEVLETEDMWSKQEPPGFSGLLVEAISCETS